MFLFVFDLLFVFNVFIVYIILIKLNFSLPNNYIPL